MKLLLKKAWLVIERKIFEEHKIWDVRISNFDILLLGLLLIGATIYNLYIGLIFLVISITLLFHEMGHIFFMKKFSYKELKIHLYGFIGFAEGKKKRYDKKEQLIVLLGGAVPGIILGSILHMIHLIYPAFLLSLFSKSLIIINFFNLLPILPLDGGHYIKILLYGEKLYPKVVHQVFSISAFWIFFSLTGEPVIFILLLFLLLGLIVSLIDIYVRWALWKRGRKDTRVPLYHAKLKIDQRIVFVSVLLLLYGTGVYYYFTIFP